MKYLLKIFSVFLLIGAGFSCKNTDLDLQDNPNYVSPEGAELDYVYNSVQLAFEYAFSDSQGAAGATARMYGSVAYDYSSFTPASTYDGLWYDAYADLFPDVDLIVEDLATEPVFGIYAGSSKIMKAYVLLTLVDLLGDVPLTEAGVGLEAISPVADPGEQVYQAALDLLDDAIFDLEEVEDLEAETVSIPSNQLLFESTDKDELAGQWIMLANSLKFKAALNMGDASAIKALIADGRLISATADDFQFNFGNQRTNPNSRHPFYNSHYETGDGDYLSNYYMFMLRADKLDEEENIIIDPRIRYYFYRKVNDAAGQDGTTYGCHFSTLPDQSAKPSYYTAVDPRLPYCYAWEDGYIGRDHLNGEGIPPDGPIRTSYGLYPGGGDFDDETFVQTNATGTAGALGGLGEGIWPIMLSSFVDFMRAEAALTLGTGEDSRALLESAVRKSIEKVVSFESLVSSKMSSNITLRDGSLTTVKELYGTSDEDIEDYLDEVLAMYDAADAAGKLDVVITEYYIAAWGNGLEAYNMYKRTGYPSNMAPALEANPGAFPRSFYYPSTAESRNANIDQKVNLSTKVFWDDGTIDLY